MSVFRSVIVPFCQIHATVLLPYWSREKPTTWLLLLMVSSPACTGAAIDAMMASKIKIAPLL